MRDKKTLKLNVGIPSIILILLVLALSVFAVLSIRAAYNELKLAKKTKESVTAFYKADSEATFVLAKLDELFQSGEIEFIVDKLTLMKEISDIHYDEFGRPNFLTYQVTVGKDSNLIVSIDLFWKDGSFHYYDIKEWKVVHVEQTNEVEIENDIGIWDGQIAE